MPNLSDALRFISDNQFGAGLSAAMVMAGLVWLVRSRKERSDSKRILAFLEESARETSHTFRSTEAIAAAVKLPEARVELLCSHNPKIARNGAAKQSWRIAK